MLEDDSDDGSDKYSDSAGSDRASNQNTNKIMAIRPPIGENTYSDKDAAISTYDGVVCDTADGPLTRLNMATKTMMVRTAMHSIRTHERANMTDGDKNANIYDDGDTEDDEGKAGAKDDDIEDDDEVIDDDDDDDDYDDENADPDDDDDHDGGTGNFQVDNNFNYASKGSDDQEPL